MSISPEEVQEIAAAAIRTGPEPAKLGAVQVARVTDTSVLAALQECLKSEGQAYSLSLVAGWQIEHRLESKFYEIGREELKQERSDLPSGFPFVSLRLNRYAKRLGIQLAGPLNEALVLLGVRHSKLAEILANGVNERFGSGPYGKGIHLAEDVCQFQSNIVDIDTHKTPGRLHELLYPGDMEHPGSVSYMLICTALLGYVARTTDGEHLAGGGALWADSRTKRELAPIPGLEPAAPHHSLLAEKSGASRQVVIFHSERVISKYLVAYRLAD